MINAINGFKNVGIGNLHKVRTSSSSENIFSKMIENSISRVSDYQKIANDSLTSFIKGNENEIHNVMIAMEEAKLTMQAAIEIRNKIVEAYQELSRTQI